MYSLHYIHMYFCMPFWLKVHSFEVNYNFNFQFGIRLLHPCNSTHSEQILVQGLPMTKCHHLVGKGHKVCNLLETLTLRSSLQVTQGLAPQISQDWMQYQVIWGNSLWMQGHRMRRELERGWWAWLLVLHLLSTSLPQQEQLLSGSGFKQLELLMVFWNWVLIWVPKRSTKWLFFQGQFMVTAWQHFVSWFLLWYTHGLSFSMNHGAGHWVTQTRHKVLLELLDHGLQMTLFETLIVQFHLWPLWKWMSQHS